MIIGIPDFFRRASLPSTDKSSTETWRLNVQEHNAEKAGLHYDLRLNPTGSEDAHSWALRSTSLPGPGQKILAVEQPTHARSYMGWSGNIPEGYGAGDVKSIIDQNVEVLESEPDKIVFVSHASQVPQRYILKRTSGNDWLLYNFTSTEDNELIPNYKPHYKEIGIASVHANDDNEVLAPKIDGAHNTIILRPEKRIDLYSYRSSKRSKERIDHSYKTDLYKLRSPKELGTTVLRGELYIDKQPASVISGVLNSNTEKAREKQKEVGPLKVMAFDVVRFKNKLVENAPYREKLEMLKEVQQYIPGIELPELAATPAEKIKLLDRVRMGQHEKTKEGVVVYKLDEAVPIKAKIKSDYDVLITGTYPATPGSKYSGNAIGGFIGIPEGKKNTIQIGSGLSDELRRAAYQNPERFIGNWAKIEGQLEYEASGKLRMPVFKGFRLDKY